MYRACSDKQEAIKLTDDMTRNNSVLERSRYDEIRTMDNIRRLPRKLRLTLARCLIVLLLLFCVFALILYLCNDSYPNDDELRNFIRSSYNLSDEIPNKYLMWSSKCHMLSMNPDDPSIKPFVKKEKYEACSTKPRLTRITRDINESMYLIINHDAAKYYKDLSCCWAAISRPNVSIEHDEQIDSKISEGTCEDFKDRVYLLENIEVVLVICRDRDAGEIYKNIHAVINPKRVRHRLLNNISQQKINSTHSSTKDEKEKIPSVLILGLDSISRLNFYRTMPTTRSYFEEKKWTELRTYNKMGDNTFPNLMAILTGLNETMSHSECNQLPQAFDNCPMIWYNFRDAGYATAYAEDTAEINTFNNGKAGFVNPPTDYYLRPYVMATENQLPIRKRFNSPYCTGPELSADRIFDAAVDFAKAFKEKPSFGFFWTNSLSHEYMNGPSMYDTRFLAKLQDMEDHGVMNDSVIIVLSDHGMRFGDSRDTFIGWYEERLPFVYMWLPQWFRDQNPDVNNALLDNQDRLTSPYDMYETLRDILQRAGGQAPPSSGCPKCSSLFKPLPDDRGCKEAGISPHWCTCIAFESVEAIDETIVLEGAKKFVEYVNNVTEEYTTNLGIRLCSKLYLKRIARVKKLIDLDDENISNEKVLKLFYTLELTPGGGKFETTIVYHGLGKYTIQEEEVSRINLYGHDAICLEKGYKKYCQCRLKVANFILKWF